MKRTIIVTLLAVCGGGGPVMGAVEQPARPATATNGSPAALVPSPLAVSNTPAGVVQASPAYINELSAELRSRHPAMAAAYARTNAAGANVDAVKTWEDPMARLGGMAAREEMRADDGDLIYGVEQKLPLFGRPRLARSIARAEMQVEGANAEYQFQQLRSELAKDVFAAALAGDIVRLGQQDLAWLDAMVQTMEERYRAGQATLFEVLQVQNERAKRATALKTDQEKQLHEHFRLNRILNRKLDSPWPELSLPPLAGPVFYNDKVVEFALKYEPRLAVLRGQVDQAKRTVELTRKQRLPEVSAGVEARNYTGNGSFRQGMLVLNMSLPWGNGKKYRSEVKRDQAKLEATQWEVADYQLGLQEEVHGLTVKIDAARREALLYRDQVMPRSQSALDTAQSGWLTGRNVFRDVLDARRMLLDARLMLARATAEQYQMLSELVLCCGLGDLEALQMIGAAPDEKTPN